MQTLPSRLTASICARCALLLVALVAPAALYAQLNYATPYTFTTLAGAIHNSGWADGTGTAASFSLPYAVAVDTAGTIYVADTSNYTIRKVTPSGAVTTLAGAAFQAGSSDGTGSAARFVSPRGIAVDTAGSIYVSDTDNHTIRKITPAGIVTTLAGTAGNPGSADGTGPGARFSYPRGLAVDGTGNLFVADTGNSSVRKVTAAGVVTTLATQFSFPTGAAVDQAGTVYVADASRIFKITKDGTLTTLAGSGVLSDSDGVGLAASFSGARGVAVDSVGNVYAANESTIRKVTPAGVVTTLAGNPYFPVFHNGTGMGATFSYITGIAVDGALNVYVVGIDSVVSKGTSPPPSIAVQPSSISVSLGSAASFQITYNDSPAPAVRWQVSTDGGGTWANLTDSGNYTGSTTTTLVVAHARSSMNGYQYRCVGTNAVGSTNSSAATLTVAQSTGPVTNANRLINISTRSLVGTSDNVQIAGFVISGSAPKQVVIRASGPVLAAKYGVAGALADPMLELHDQGTGATLATNDDWDAALAADFAAVGAFAWTAGSKDAALVTTLDPGQYTVIVKGKNNGTGVALVEVYDADTGTPGSRLINISTRSLVGTGDNVQIAGFVVSGSAPKQVVIRASGPVLAANYGVVGVLADPLLELHDQGTGETLATNDDWDATLAIDFAAVGAFAWTAGSKDAALVTTLDPGQYTVVVKGKNSGTGVALVEVYEEP